MRGFSLLEVMIVVCIVAVLASLAALAVVPGEAALAEKEARRLALLLELAVVETRASGQRMAWTPAPGGYTFLQRSEAGEWLPFPDSSPYRPRALGASLALEGARVAFSPYGLQAPLVASIRGGNAQFILRSGALGRVSLERLHAD